MVMYFDLDCRFDARRLSNGLKLRIMEASATTLSTYWRSSEGTKMVYSTTAETFCTFDDELFLTCMRRFLYTRCYNSIEFLSALKTMHHHSQKESEALGTSVHFLMIDSIGAFQWIDRACQPLHHCGNKRKIFSLQVWAETVVQEIRNLLQVQPLLVLATKATIYGAGTSIHSASRAPGRWSSEGMASMSTSRREGEKVLYHDYMPSAWQSLVTHRIHLGVSGKNHENCPTYTSEWVQPWLNTLDEFTVKDDGIFMIS